MRNGDTLEGMLKAIRAAQTTIDFSSYIYWAGPTAERFTDALVERAGAGVEVNLLLDGYGSAKLDRDHLARLRAGGVSVCRFRPPRWRKLSKLNNRMHRRILVVDGALAFGGGVGVADVWTGNAEDPEHWRETHLQVEGPAVLDLFGAFVETWSEATGRVLAGTHVAQPEQVEGGVTV